jgi:hypothetical protein
VAQFATERYGLEVSQHTVCVARADCLLPCYRVLSRRHAYGADLRAKVKFPFELKYGPPASKDKKAIIPESDSKIQVLVTSLDVTDDWYLRRDGTVCTVIVHSAAGDSKQPEICVRVNQRLNGTVIAQLCSAVQRQLIPHAALMDSGQDVPSLLAAYGLERFAAGARSNTLKYTAKSGASIELDDLLPTWFKGRTRKPTRSLLPDRDVPLRYAAPVPKATPPRTAPEPKSARASASSSASAAASKASASSASATSARAVTPKKGAAASAASAAASAAASSSSSTPASVGCVLLWSLFEIPNSSVVRTTIRSIIGQALALLCFRLFHLSKRCKRA